MRILFLVITMFFSSFALAQGNSNFQFAPAPVPHPFYDLDQTNVKLTGTYLDFESEEMELSGVGFNAGFRQTIKDTLAWDGLLGLNILAGDFKGSYSGDMMVLATHYQIDLEFLAYQSENGSVILFGGLGMDLNVGAMTVQVGPPIGELSSSVFSFLYSIPIGIQGGYKVNDQWTLAPFVMFTSTLGGTVATDDTSDSIDAFTSTSYGFDVFYEPQSLSIGTLLTSMADAGAGGKASDVLMIQLSWNKRQSRIDNKNVVTESTTIGIENPSGLSGSKELDNKEGVTDPANEAPSSRMDGESESQSPPETNSSPETGN
ncbi:MAG: hypothetical protein KDD43_03855 [Bdellovibrionales bacterium]|nr:hypothetical protein [Bdellovibrionales bacterium]